MKIIITESQYKKYKHLFEQSVYGDEDYDSNTGYGNEEYDTKEGMTIEGEIKSLPVKFTYSEMKEIENGEIEYYGEVTFNGDEFLGVIVTDKRGFLTDYDFYSTLSDDEVRLQDIIEKENSDHEIENFFQEDVINILRR
jgi:hypothetical protein